MVIERLYFGAGGAGAADVGAGGTAGAAWTGATVAVSAVVEGGAPAVGA